MPRRMPPPGATGGPPALDQPPRSACAAWPPGRIRCAIHPRSRGTTSALSPGMLMPPISRYMTRQPWTIEPSATLTAAHLLMRRHAIRHLPVVDAGVLVGIVTERDLHLIETLRDADPDEV